MTFTQGLILASVLAAAYVLARSMLRMPAPVDPWVAAIWRRQMDDAPDVRNLNFDVELRHTDNKDRTTVRRVTVREAWGSFGPQGGFELRYLMRGWCHMRDAERVFHVMNMDSVTDLQTGETFAGRWRIERFLSRKIGMEVRAGRGQRREAEDRPVAR